MAQGQLQCQGRRSTAHGHERHQKSRRSGLQPDATAIRVQWPHPACWGCRWDLGGRYGVGQGQRSRRPACSLAWRGAVSRSRPSEHICFGTRVTTAHRSACGWELEDRGGRDCARNCARHGARTVSNRAARCRTPTKNPLASCELASGSLCPSGITNRLLYQLSYVGPGPAGYHICRGFSSPSRGVPWVWPGTVRDGS